MASISALQRLAKVAKNGAFGGFRDPRTSQKDTFYQFLEDPLIKEHKATPFVRFQAIW